MNTCNCTNKDNILHGCFGEDVPILLHNNLIKKSQDIVVGDILMGDDSTERVVEEVITGEDDLFEVRQINGIKYTVNTKHTLLLKDVMDNEKESIFGISTEQYMSLNDLYKSMISGYKIIPNKTEHENSPITISLIGKGIYYGFAISNNKKFVLPDYTVVHNCNTKYCKTCNKEIK
jgi:replicative DNA helicase